MRKTIPILVVTLFTICIAAGILIILDISSPFAASTAEEEILATVGCTNLLISPTENSSIHNTIFSSEDGQIIYLIDNGMGSEVIHVQADGTQRNLGTIPIYIVHRPAWVIDLNRGKIFYKSFTHDDSYTWNIESLDLITGEQRILAEDVQEFGFGQVDNHIWWSKQYELQTQTVIYNPDTEEREVANFPADSTGLIFARPLRLLPNQEAIFSISPAYKEYFYQASLETGESWQLFRDELSNSVVSSPESSLLLENSLVYINSDGILKEIDFEGNILRSIPLQGQGRYGQIIPSRNGFVYIFWGPEDTLYSGLYYVAASGNVHQLTPDVDNFHLWPVDIAVVTNPQGQEQIWFSTEQSSEDNTGTLYAYTIPEDTQLMPRLELTVENVAGFQASPRGNYIVFNENRQGYVISTENFQTITAIGAYYGSWAFSEPEDRIFFSDETALFAYNFEEAEQYKLYQSEQDLSLFFLDSENELVYFYENFYEETGGMGTRKIFVVTFDAATAMQVSLPDIKVPRDTHSAGLQQTTSGDIVYFQEDWDRLYRAECHRNGA